MALTLQLQSCSLTLGVFFEYVVNDGVNVLINILEEAGEAVLDGELQLLQKVVVVERAHLQSQHR